MGELENTIRKENWEKEKLYRECDRKYCGRKKNIIDITMQRTEFLNIASQKITSRQTMSKRY